MNRDQLLQKEGSFPETNLQITKVSGNDTTLTVENEPTYRRCVQAAEKEEKII